MDISRRNLAFGSVGLLAGTAFGTAARADGGLLPFEGVEDFWIATDAYIYGHPLVTMEMTRWVMTNVASARGRPRPHGLDRQGAGLS